MTVTRVVFESQMRYLHDNGYTVIPLRRLVDRYRGRGEGLPPKAVVIVVDDGHQSVYRDMLPVIRRYRYPVTLFVYPSAISNASYAMTWEQLRSLKGSGLFDVQSHTYWHPNFRTERKRLSGLDFDRFVSDQLRRSRLRLERELGGRVDLLAWPFGIQDEYLMGKAAQAGYVAAFSIQRRHCTPGDNIMSLPRYLLRNSDSDRAFAHLLEDGNDRRKGGGR